MIDKTAIKRNFSKYAHCYDKYSLIQDKCAASLGRYLGKTSQASILDIGCGTGNYTKLLFEKFPKAKITAVDISKEMIVVARGKFPKNRIEFMVSDAEELNLEEKFSLITSNASFQWFKELKQSLSKYRQLLKTGGIIAFSIFGPQTFCELNHSLVEFNKNSIVADSFKDKASIEVLLKKLFRKSDIERKVFIEQYDSLPKLLKTIKYTGTTGSGLGLKKLWTPGKIAELEKIYLNKFKKITATYEVFFCKGIK